MRNFRDILCASNTDLVQFERSLFSDLFSVQYSALYSASRAHSRKTWKTRKKLAVSENGFSVAGVYLRVEASCGINPYPLDGLFYAAVSSILMKLGRLSPNLENSENNLENLEPINNKYFNITTQLRIMHPLKVRSEGIP